MTRFRPVAILPLILTLLAPPAWAGQGDPIPSKDIVLQGDPNAIIALDRSGSVQAVLNAGRIRIHTACRGGGGCAPTALTALRVNGRTVALPGPAQVFELDLSRHSGPVRLHIEVEVVQGQGRQTRIDGRPVTVAPRVAISDQAAAGNLIAFFPDASSRASNRDHIDQDAQIVGLDAFDWTWSSDGRLQRDGSTGTGRRIVPGASAADPHGLGEAGHDSGGGGGGAGAGGAGAP